MVVGAKFELVDDTFILRIKEGQLLPNGSINPETLKWEKGTRNPSDSMNFLQYSMWFSSAHLVNVNLWCFSDRWKIAKSDSFVKAFDLTEIELSEGHIVIGLVVELIDGEKNHDERFALSVFSAGYDFEKGTIKKDDDVNILNRPKSSRLVFEFLL